MGIFGWSYPPGAANDPNAPYNQIYDHPCQVCGQFESHCICPECPVCEAIGDPTCYGGMMQCSRCGVTTQESINSCIFCTDPSYPVSHSPIEGHGLVRTKAQIDSLSNAEAGWAEQARAEAEYEAKYIEEMEKYDDRR